MSESQLLTFSQAYGYEDVPAPLQLEQLPTAARMRIWSVLFKHLKAARYVVYELRTAYVREPWKSILEALHVQRYVEPSDKFTGEFDSSCRRLREDVLQSEFHKVFDLIVFIMRRNECPRSFVWMMDVEFKECQLAYMVDPGPPPAIVPATTRVEGDQLIANLKELRTAGLGAATTHLDAASKCINDGDWRGSVHESISAVETVAKQISGENTLGKALVPLLKRGVLPHTTLKKSLGNLYDYASDEPGIRHALAAEGEANVTKDEALFMLGACASWANYLWRRHKAASTP